MTVGAPEWIVAGNEGRFTCTFPFGDISDVNSVYWSVGNQTNDNEFQTDVLVYYKDGGIHGPAKDRVNMNPETFVLTIPTAQYPLDNKRYWCSASTTVGSNDDSKNCSISGKYRKIIGPTCCSLKLIHFVRQLRCTFLS